MAYVFGLACLAACVWYTAADNKTEQAHGYEKQVLTDLCQYNGVKFVRDADDVQCGYMACWEGRPHGMKCPLGTRTHPNFFWGVDYPCSQLDVHNDCNGLKKYLEEQEREQRKKMEAERKRLSEFRMWQMLQKHIAEHPQLSSLENEDTQDNGESSEKYIDLDHQQYPKTIYEGDDFVVPYSSHEENRLEKGRAEVVEDGVSFTPYRTNAVDERSRDSRRLVQSANDGTYIVEPMR